MMFASGGIGRTPYGALVYGKPFVAPITGSVLSISAHANLNIIGRSAKRASFNFTPRSSLNLIGKILTPTPAKRVFLAYKSLCVLRPQLIMGIMDESLENSEVMMGLAQSAVTVEKSAATNEDFQIDWSQPSRQLGGDTIATSTWAYSGKDTALTLSNPSLTTLTTTIWVAGGTVGKTYVITNTVMTAAGRTFTESFAVVIVPFVYLSSENCC